MLDSHHHKFQTGPMRIKFYLSILAFTLTITIGNAQILRAFAPRYSNSSVRGNIVYVSNNIITSNGGITTEAPPGGSSTNNGNTAANIDISGTTIVPSGSNWKYWSNTLANFQTNWQTVGYSDAAWPAGNGELGYGDGDEATCIASGGGGTLCNPTGNKWVTAYFRKTVNIPNPALYSSFQFSVERDDGYVLYINGVEYSRNNMPAGAVSWVTPASSAIEDAVITFSVPNTAFVAGNNLIAVEVHQASVTAGPPVASSSSDISFNLQLTASASGVFNSSSADLSLPTCTQVLWAGLYWGATQGVDGTNTSWITGESNIKLKVPGSAVFQNLVSTQTDYHNGTLVPGLPHTGYQGFVDVTSLINATNPNGTYTVANVASPAGIVNGAGGWTIVIAYADPTTIVRNLTVFDGSAIMNGGDPALHVPITGFLTPPTGPVSCELGAVVYDGDRVSQDEFSFKQNSNPLVGVYTNLTPNATSNLNDMWNSTISYKGAVVTTRNPAHQNTLGYDADIINVPNAANAVLGNSQNSASIQFSSPSENYTIQVATTSISQYTPSFNMSKAAVDVNGGSLAPGDQLRYDISYLNGGNDASVSTIITDNIPVGTTYKPGSLLIGGVSKTDAAGDDEAEYDFLNNRVIYRLGVGATSAVGGEVAANGSGSVSFVVYTASSCAVNTCGSTITNSARISYNGKISLLSLYDSSGVLISGCNVPGPVSSTLTGSCMPMADTLLANICPSLSVTIPLARYAGYNFYTATPFIPANLYNPATPITFTRTIYAFYNGAGSCDDTIRINIFISACPDIDDDNDGIPDYVEINNPNALLDHDSDGIPNWNDTGYPGYVDNNADGFNDNFDPSADSDNDGIANFNDPSFPGYVDSNGDGINDTMDKDLDGIPNHLDLDSDNDGIPDTVESFGVDANGDGRIDNYSDTDNDGLSQNVDNAGGVSGSGLGLGALDTDADGIPNYLDLDSDNDGVPDVVEVYGTDTNNDGRLDGFVDTDFDGLSDIVDGDVGNDNTAENSASALLATGADANNDGRADSFPNKNMDVDTKPNPYDLDSDGDGIADVREANFTDTNFDGRVDGAVNANGWNTTVAALGSLGLPNTDGSGRVNVYDIDSDNDGIPDNIEGQTTSGYLLPAGTDTDGDGIDNNYDNFVGFGGDGVHPPDTDGDTVRDYMDLDTDNDGLIDIIEGNDFNFNKLPDDNVTLTGNDTDGDGLDDRFDNNNSSVEGTSNNMGNGGSTSGDLTPGSITVVQHTSTGGAYGCATERDWRCQPYVLSCNMITFKAALLNQQAGLDWTVVCKQPVDHFVIERSTDKINFSDRATVIARNTTNENDNYSTMDDLSGISAYQLYYRLRTISPTGQIGYSNIITLNLSTTRIKDILIMPNPVRNKLQVQVSASIRTIVDFHIVNTNGAVVRKYKEKVPVGTSLFIYADAGTLPNGVYYLKVLIDDELIIRKFSVLK